LTSLRLGASPVTHAAAVLEQPTDVGLMQRRRVEITRGLDDRHDAQHARSSAMEVVATGAVTGWPAAAPNLHPGVDRVLQLRCCRICLY
jgi:hypothetical protein